MSLRISGKHMNVGDALTGRIEERLDDAITKYFQDGYTGHVTLEKQSNRYTCECIIHLNSGVDLQSTSLEVDPTVSFETAADKIEKRLRRYKRRLKDHHGKSNKAARIEAAYSIVETPNEADEVPEDYNPVIIAESLTNVDTQTVAGAVMKLDLIDSPVVVFTNAGNGKTNVVYKRPDGNIGWIDPS